MRTPATRPTPTRRSRPGRRRFAVLLAGIAAVVVTAGALAATASAGPARTALATSAAAAVTPSAAVRNAVERAAALGIHGTVHYATVTPLCATPKDPKAYRCFALARHAATSTTKGAHPYVTSAAITHGPAGGYTPADLAGAYGYNPKAKVNQTIGIVDWYDDPHALADLNVFDKHYGLPAETKTSFRKVNQRGVASPLPKPDAGTSGEIALDIESARAVCNSCKIVLVEASAPSDAALAAAENEAVKLGATEISNSFGAPEVADNVSAATVAAYNHPGIVVTAATGDNGWYGWDFFNNGGTSQNSASFPSTDPAVVAVGGTEIAINTAGKRAAEVVWNENGPGDDAGSTGSQGATGGGCSREFAATPWQAHYAHYADSDCQGRRLAADVSALADPTLGLDIYLTYGGNGWLTAGGTSLASPITAGEFALAGGSHGAAYASSTLYVNAQVHPASVFDVVPFNPQHLAAGNSLCGGEDPGFCNTLYDNPNGLGKGYLDCSLPFDGSAPTGAVSASPECNSAPGLDGPTGLGTPASLRLFQQTTPIITLKGPAKVRAKHAVTFVATVQQTVANTRVTTYDWLFGDGTSGASKTPSVRHTFAKPGKHTVTLYVVDNRYQETIKTLSFVATT